MEKISLKARAKINLNLDVVGRRKDGYHLLNMIMQQIDLYDIVSISKSASGIKIKTDSEKIIDDESNIAYRAAAEMKKRYSQIEGVEIQIEKKIPIAAGLAGGSSDGAAVISGINMLYELSLDAKTLADIGLNVGADLPFCIIGGCAAVEGIGDIIKPIKGLTDKWVLISKPPVDVSTKEIYLGFDLEDIRTDFDFQEIIKAVEEQKIHDFKDLMNNSLESVTLKKYEIVRDMKEKFKETEPDFYMMSGSGPTVFGIYENYERALCSYEKIKKFNTETYLVKTYNNLGGGYYGE